MSLIVTGNFCDQTYQKGEVDEHEGRSAGNSGLNSAGKILEKFFVHGNCMFC